MDVENHRIAPRVSGGDDGAATGSTVPACTAGYVAGAAFVGTAGGMTNERRGDQR